MNNNRLAKLLADVVIEVLEDKSEIIIYDELKEDIWDAYNEIKDRKCKLVNGTFVKEGDL